jgi:3-deoxy-D-manno-octulosonate 8-phosphate phosphatase (KDO 8-P phosphatase)
MQNKKIKIFFDVDGVLTDGKFQYDKNGKKFKTFGPDDNDAIKLLKKKNFYFITSDKRGFAISKKRIVDDMNCKLFLVPSSVRLNWIKKKGDNSKIIYMGDSFKDIEIFKFVDYSIAPNNCYYDLKKYSNFITNHDGGNRAVAEAVLHIIKKFKL